MSSWDGKSRGDSEETASNGEGNDILHVGGVVCLELRLRLGQGLLD